MQENWFFDRNDTASGAVELYLCPPMRDAVHCRLSEWVMVIAGDGTAAAAVVVGRPSMVGRQKRCACEDGLLCSSAVLSDRLAHALGLSRVVDAAEAVEAVTLGGCSAPMCELHVVVRAGIALYDPDIGSVAGYGIVRALFGKLLVLLVVCERRLSCLLAQAGTDKLGLLTAGKPTSATLSAVRDQRHHSCT